MSGVNKELIKRLYEQSVVNAVEANPGASPCPAWAWEEAFAKAIVLECSRVAKLATGSNKVCDAIEQHFGIEL